MNRIGIYLYHMASWAFPIIFIACLYFFRRFNKKKAVFLSACLASSVTYVFGTLSMGVLMRDGLGPDAKTISYGFDGLLRAIPSISIFLPSFLVFLLGVFVHFCVPNEEEYLSKNSFTSFSLFEFLKQQLGYVMGLTVGLWFSIPILFSHLSGNVVAKDSMFLFFYGLPFSFFSSLIGDFFHLIGFAFDENLSLCLKISLFLMNSSLIGFFLFSFLKHSLIRLKRNDKNQDNSKDQ